MESSKLLNFNILLLQGIRYSHVWDLSRSCIVFKQTVDINVVIYFYLLCLLEVYPNKSYIIFSLRSISIYLWTKEQKLIVLKYSFFFWVGMIMSNILIINRKVQRYFKNEV